MSELVERGEKMLRDGLESPNSNPSKLNDSICAQLCVLGLEALAKATRYKHQHDFGFKNILIPGSPFKIYALVSGHLWIKVFF